MNRDRVLAAIAGAVGILAVAVAGGATDTTRTEQSTSGDGDGSSTVVPEGWTQGAVPHESIFPEWLFHFVWTLPILTFVALLVGSSLWYIYRHGLRAYLSVFTDLVTIVVAASAAAIIVGGPHLYLLVRQEGDDPVPVESDPDGGLEGSPEPGGSPDPLVTDSLTQLPLEAFAVALIVVFLALFALIQYRREPSSRTRSSGSNAVSADEPGVGNVHSESRPAEPWHVAHQEATNGVYHAWLSLCRATGGQRRVTETPGEVATEAVDAGLDERGVREVTSLFEAVRYGGRSPTPERERRARDAAASFTVEDERP
ncbi:DUF4129 domain-containing protein [Natronobiforma cellulositropha]|uniref:DUF4129 domain-containing protein n=1 Tax=Natronobiforma cellulositropha TaxID=1679076 RepID=UPI0021D5F6D4|nr:DUF4129 domain-containing protein [Natronobiforma cellulositropha]